MDLLVTLPLVVLVIQTGNLSYFNWLTWLFKLVTMKHSCYITTNDISKNNLQEASMLLKPG